MTSRGFLSIFILNIFIFCVIYFAQTEIFIYMKEDRYTTRRIYPVCINLEPRHFEFLKEIAITRFNGNFPLAIQSLLNKYQNHLYEIRITPTKQTETATYQPKTKQYKRRTINMNPVLWSKLFESRHFVGYSISALIRILLDWEMQSLGYDIIPMIPLPDLNTSDIGNIEQQPPELWFDNYFYNKQGFYETREIICSFYDEYH